MAFRPLKSHKIQAALFYPIFFLSKFSKRDERLWLFGPMNHAFLDNAKYLFLHILENHPDIKVFFVTEKKTLCRAFREKHLPCLYKWSIKGIYFGLKAKYYFVSAYIHDINYWTSGGAVVFNLWHGIPLKKIEFDITTGPLAKKYHKKSLKLRLLKPWLYRKPDYVLSTSPLVSRLFASAFRVKENQCPTLGYPRTDPFFWPAERLWQHIQKWESPQTSELCRSFSAYRHVLLYMPTWRDDRSDFLRTAFPDLNALENILAEQNALLLIKLHPNDGSMRLFSDTPHIKSLPAKMDLYPILPFTHVLITDYSSIFFDYMLLKRPILFYAFDLENYTKLRALYFDYEEATPGEIIQDFDTLLNRLSQLDTLTLSANFQDLLHRFWSHTDGQSSQRIVEFVKHREASGAKTSK